MVKQQQTMILSAYAGIYDLSDVDIVGRSK